ncbi:MAG: 2-oxoglutarate dehydrogenase E1 component [Myxococcota bacterium]
MELPSHSLAFVEELYAQYLEDPSSVAEDWRKYFEKWAHEQHEMTNGDPIQIGPSFPTRSIFNPRTEATALPKEPDREMPILGDFVRGEPSGPSAGLGLPDYDPSNAKARQRFLRALALFRSIDDADIEALDGLAKPVRFSDGETIIREGERSNDLFIVASGEIEVRRGGHGLVVRLGRGEVIGEMALFDAQPRAADVVANGSVELLELEGDQVMDLVRRRPSLAQSLLETMARRLRETSSRQDRVDQLIRAYRVRGHLQANLDPLGLANNEAYSELEPSFYGFDEKDLDLVFSSSTIPGPSARTLREIIDHLKKTYCRDVGVQFMHIDDLRMKSWLQERMEATQNVRKLGPEEQLRILTKLTDAEIFEQFIHKKFIGSKRFSLEGAESLIPLLDLAVEQAGDRGVREIVIGMAHRGRLNVLANILEKSPRNIFREFDDANADAQLGRGDVKYHLGYSHDRTTASGKPVHLSLSFNPSHLEFVNPVVLGRIRAKQDRYGDVRRRAGLGILIHGDASFAGQGIVQETLNMSGLKGYQTGGTLHVIVNNQIGFTTNPEESRSTQYATDVAKMLQIPIIHVNGEHPEAVAQAIYLALEFREVFGQDVVIDMYCYRLHGHNEGDEPAFTQPKLYKEIRARKTVRESYVDNLFALGSITPEQAERISIERRSRLDDELGAARERPQSSKPDLMHGQGVWQAFGGGKDVKVSEVPTAVDESSLKASLQRLTNFPASFRPHPKFGRLVTQREEMVAGTRALDWAAGEALAYATLLSQGVRVRLTGQDSERGTFSHRHSVLHDSESGEELNVYAQFPGTFEVHNSPLSEAGVLGYEYGYSLDYPEGLVIWEAQFGDFMNGAQVIIDQFITSGEDKWNRLSGLVMLLPHGFEGQGPEHSSARLERFLVAAADDNIQVCNLTTPAQIFHALRRQVLRPIRKPLVIMSPKSLLRHPRAVSAWRDFSEGGFQRLIGDVRESVQPDKVRRVLLCSGKLYYELEERREREGIDDVALLRMEQLYPLSAEAIATWLSPYPNGAEYVWVQEEPKNMGAWGFMMTEHSGRLMDRPLRLVARPPSASPATGSNKAHRIEQERILEEAFR